jgi:predicted cupin superfamily sugar epimerase
MAKNLSAQEVIETLNLSPHPEKGYYVETFRDRYSSNGRSHSTCIYYLLDGKSGPSQWHRVLDGAEIWHYYAGAPLQLSLSWNDGSPIRDIILGIDFEKVSYFSKYV